MLFSGASEAESSAALESLINEKRDRAEQTSDNQGVELPAGRPLERLFRRQIFLPLDSFGRKLVGPGENDRDRKSEQKKNDHQSHAPAWDFENWKRCVATWMRSHATTA